MKAVTFSQFGGPEVLRIAELPEPRPAAGEVVVQVAAATVNPTDLAFLNGVRAPSDIAPPYIAGMDFSGRVVSIGTGVESLELGMPVIGVVAPRTARGGALRERIAVPAASVAPVREDTDLVAGASVPMNALTALLSLQALGLRRGQTLLVTGVTGMLGSLSAQVALLDGLNVVANAREKDHAFIEELGVRAILPRDEGLEEAIATQFPDGLDGIIDGALVSQRLAHLVRDGGGIVSPRAVYRVEDPRLNVTYVQVTSGLQDKEKFLRIGRLLDEGRLTPRVAPGGVFPFDRAADAFRMVGAGGFRGRVVVTFQA
jgi:NADPH2:quinone reductase